MITKQEFSTLLILYTAWLIAIHLILFLSISTLPLQFGFLGGRSEQYLHNPPLRAFVNFDGEHYLSIVTNGYRDLQHFYFPMYVIITKSISVLLSIKEIFAGVLVSRVSLFIATVGLYKLIKLDFNNKIAYRSVLLLLLFPTSFYFASYYTESLFLMLTVWSLYLIRTKNWLTSGVIGAGSTATRIIGTALLPAFITELFLHWNNLSFYEKKRSAMSILLVPAGLLIYMYYLWKTTGDPLVFYNKVTIFGQQRSDSLIILPRVFYRYFFKILPNIDYSYFPILFVTFMEAIVGIGSTILLILSMLKLRISYTVFFLFAFLIPTFSGSFSSLPRYILVIFPVFLLGSLILDKINRVYRIAIYIMLFVLSVISASLFFRGYWIA